MKNINIKERKFLFGLYIVSTPIGNLADITFRAVEIIKKADIVICENPKHSLKLLNNLGIKKKLVSLHDHNETQVIKKIGLDLREKLVVLISDSGSPLISDPGFKLVKYCIEKNIYITTLPGPSSIIPSLQLSGLAMNEFVFLGFFPKEKKQIEVFIEKVKNSVFTTVFFVSTHKIKKLLGIIGAKLENRSVSVVKEITKLNEKVFRGMGNEIGQLILKNKDNTKGEFVVVIEGKSSKKTGFIDLNKHNSLIKKMLIKFSLTDVVEIVHKISGIKKNEVYKWVLSLKKF